MTSQSFDPDRPWQDQIDRDTVLTLLQQWIPEALAQYGFDALWAPKRLIRQLPAKQGACVMCGSMAVKAT